MDQGHTAEWKDCLPWRVGSWVQAQALPQLLGEVGGHQCHVEEHGLVMTPWVGILPLRGQVNLFLPP